jgi:hypothetical protein
MTYWLLPWTLPLFLQGWLVALLACIFGLRMSQSPLK